MPKDNISDTLQAAQHAIQTRQFEQAARLLKRAAREDPTNHRPWLMLSGLATTEGAARAYLQRAEALNPNDPNLGPARDWIAQKYGGRPQPPEPTPPPDASVPAATIAPPIAPPIATALPTAIAPAAAWFQLDLAFILVSLVLLGFSLSLAPEIPILGPIRFVLGLFTIFFLPGYSLILALFPRADDLSGVVRLGLSISLSLALIPPLALILDRLPWGIDLWPIFIAEALIILAFSLAAWLRRARLPHVQRYQPEIKLDLKGWWAAQDRTNRLIYIFLTVVILVALTAAAAIILTPQPGDYLTEFYILGPDGRIEFYPFDPTMGEPLTLTVGLTNLERYDRDYRVEVWVTGPGEIGERLMVAELNPFALPVGETVETPLTWAMPWPGDDQKVEFLLFIDDQPEPYRRLHLWLDVNPPVE